MWDFSWLERRWPGAGYEDWDRALDELKHRGYDAVRIDAYPHLVAAGADREWEILPPWNQQDWGSPAKVKVQVLPGLAKFIRKCKERSILVGLSTWFQRDSTEQRLKVRSPEQHAAIWAETLDQLDHAGVLDNVFYVDFCNEWPLDCWAPFYERPASEGGDWRTPRSLSWMRKAAGILREKYPSMPYTFSFTTNLGREDVRDVDVSFLDFLEPHRWMAQASDFYQQVGYDYERFEPKGYENLVENAERIYLSNPQHWKDCLGAAVDAVAEWSIATGKPLITTEGWSVVDYKDWPGLKWDWVKELSEWGTRKVCSTGRWAAICTSNFCGPQFVGMWRDVDWHRRLTDAIHEASLPKGLWNPA
jgi:hypothetical protein